MVKNRLYKEVTLGSKKQPTQSATQRTYRGISTVNPNNTKFSLYDIGLIKQDIINHFHISQGEKLENPSFGTIIWDVIHDPLTDALKEAVKQDVERIINNDPRVNADTIIITPYESGLQIEVELTYLKYSVTERLQLKFDQDNGLLN